MTSYQVVRIMNDGLIGVTSQFGRQLFSARKTRKETKCVDCGMPIFKGKLCWGEATSCAANRMHRVCTTCIGRSMGRLSSNDEFEALVKKATEAYAALSAEEKKRMQQEQRVSWVYGQLKLAGREVTRESVRQALEKHDEENPT
jgi:hypothetical protein